MVNFIQQNMTPVALNPETQQTMLSRLSELPIVTILS